jgi:hypothetical protein
MLSGKKLPLSEVSPQELSMPTRCKQITSLEIRLLILLESSQSFTLITNQILSLFRLMHVARTSEREIVAEVK